MLEIKNVHIENDKVNAPFLLSAYFCGLIKFVGSYSKNGVVYWQFSPKERAQTLLTQFYTKTEPHIPAKDLFDAIDTFWKQVSEARNTT
ncbi:hypothetical protein COV25_04270 [candidate division WWE3 bacterium CG10_big_fil_rev_8_21_14_0_10_35_32]|nr:MAG: hypothetical protein COV25_04270 [candidate division WWE3 bacterium CG10_big_fil_rev_8_21_14_0_10_35_32]